MARLFLFPTIIRQFSAQPLKLDSSEVSVSMIGKCENIIKNILFLLNLCYYGADVLGIKKKFLKEIFFYEKR